MNNQGTRFLKLSKLGFVSGAAWMIGFGSISLGQGVAPATSGYGNRAAQPTNQQQANQQQANQPSTNQTLGSPGNGNPASRSSPAQGSGAPTNPTYNPALNPALNQRPIANQVPASGSGTEVVTKDPWAANPPKPQEIAHLDQVLNYWEGSTKNIDKYACKFLRWQYNSSANFVDELAKKVGRDIRTVHVSTASGELKYMAPDKGMFKIDKLIKLSGQVDVKNQPEYKGFDGVFGEWWLCDGEKVYEYDRSLKKCTRFTMPPEMKGEGILESPMPFMFGVKAEKIKARYWVRSLPPPPDAQGKPRDDIFVVEAYPKFQSDAANYDHVQIYLDKELFLPVMLVKYNTEHVDEPSQILNDNREVFQFSDRVKNASLLQKVTEGFFRKEFIPTTVEKDWTVEDRVFAPPAMDNVRAANNPAPQPNNPATTRK